MSKTYEELNREPREGDKIIIINFIYSIYDGKKGTIKHCYYDEELRCNLYRTSVEGVQGIYNFRASEIGPDWTVK